MERSKKACSHEVHDAKSSHIFIFHSLLLCFVSFADANCIADRTRQRSFRCRCAGSDRESDQSRNTSVPRGKDELSRRLHVSRGSSRSLPVAGSRGGLQGANYSAACASRSGSRIPRCFLADWLNYGNRERER